MQQENNNSNELVIFKPSSGDIEFQVILDGKAETIWATQQQMMDLFGKARRTIGAHIKNIYLEEELDKNATWREIRQVQVEGQQANWLLYFCLVLRTK